MSSEARNKRCYALYDKGLEALERRNFNKALRIAEKLHESRYTGAFELEARTRYEMGDRQDATRILETGLRKYPNVYILASYLGEYLSNQGHYQLAIEAFEKARSGDQDTDSYADLNIGVCYSRMEMHDHAAEYYAKVNYSPGYHGWLFYWVCKSRHEWSTGNFDQFLKDCAAGLTVANREKSRDVKQLAAWLYAYRAEFYLDQGNRGAAEEDLNAAKKLDQHLEQVLFIHRKLYGRHLNTGTSFYVLLRGTAHGLNGMPKRMEMLSRFYIIAESESDLPRLAQQHAEDWQTWEKVEKVIDTKEFQDVHEGVTWMQEGGGLVHNFGLLSRIRARLSGAKIWKHE